MFELDGNRPAVVVNRVRETGESLDERRVVDARHLRRGTAAAVGDDASP